MSAQPQRTLVSRKRYIQVMGLKLSLFAVGAGAIGGGLIAGFAFMNEIVISLVYPHETRFTLLDCTAFAVGAGMLLMCGAVTYRKSHKIAAIELTTPQNAHLLPVQETLVRASVQPPSHQKAELLRAAQYGKETPAEELLRATQGNRKDG